MKYSLMHLLLFTALVAMGIAWWVDHTRLSRENSVLNAEAAEMFSQRTMKHSSTMFNAMSFPDGKLPPTRLYDFRRPEDRDEYERVYGHLMYPKFPWLAGEH